MKRVSRYLQKMLFPAIVTIASCTHDGQDVTIAPSGDSASSLRFTVTTDGETRSSQPFLTVDDFANKGGDFRISAWQYIASKDGSAQHAEEVLSYVDRTLQDVKVEYHDGEWTTATEYYWPQSVYTVDFFAVYPFSQDITAVNGIEHRKQKTSTYQTSDGATDMLYATYTGRRTERSYDWPPVAMPTSQEVPLVFHHALSQVAFKARLISDNLTVTISSISICNVKSQEVFSFPMKATTETNSTGKGTWATTSGQPTADYHCTMVTETPVSLSIFSQVYDLTDPASPLMLIPQTLAPWMPPTTIAETTGCYLKIGCSILMDGEEKADEGYTYVPFTNGTNIWSPGLKYTYILGFGIGYDSEGHQTNLSNITINAEVEDWDDGGTIGGVAVKRKEQQ